MPPKIYNAKKAKKAKKPNLLQGASQRAWPQRLILPPWPRQKKVGGGGPPLGVSIRRPPKVLQGVLDSYHQLPHQTPDTNIEGLVASVS